MAASRTLVNAGPEADSNQHGYSPPGMALQFAETKPDPEAEKSTHLPDRSTMEPSLSTIPEVPYGSAKEL